MIPLCVFFNYFRTYEFIAYYYGVRKIKIRVGNCYKLKKKPINLHQSVILKISTGIKINVRRIHIIY